MLEDLANISLCFWEYMNACERKSTIIQVQGRKFCPKSNFRTTPKIFDPQQNFINTRNPFGARQPRTHAILHFRLYTSVITSFI